MCERVLDGEGGGATGRVAWLQDGTLDIIS